MSNETTTPTAGATQGAPTSEGLTTQSSEWDFAAASLGDNKDVHVQVVDPLFDDQTKLATVFSVERTTADDDKGLAARVVFRIEEELIDTFGNKKAPGYTFRPRPFILVAGSAEQASQDAAERGRRDAARLLWKAGLASSAGLSMEQTVKAFGKLAGKSVLIKFRVGESKNGKRDEEGNLLKFQNFTFAAPGEKPVAGQSTGPANY